MARNKKVAEPVVISPLETEARATAKTVRVTARKARLVLDLIRGKDAKEALAILKFTPNIASEPISKCLKSAMANATNNFLMNGENLFVSECYADESITLKRIRPRAKGGASQILKRTSNITVVVKER